MLLAIMCSPYLFSLAVVGLTGFHGKAVASRVVTEYVYEQEPAIETGFQLTIALDFPLTRDFATKG